ncbi:MAG: DNA polymerase IV [Chloroflexota bacterium]|nr:DNA polymerase IV [Chloroflexota bacterium]
MGRTIVHADLDAFYASVEQLDKPELRGNPVVVGGPPESRGVVAAASYEVRKFGVHSAMPMSRALRLCPSAIRVSPRFDRYGEISRQVMAIFRSVTPLVEPLSLDEAFLDVTGRHRAYGGARGLAEHLKREIKLQTGLTVSIGVGTNKTVAKIASDKEKPDGLVVVAPGTEAQFLAPLPVRALWGVGPKSEKALIAAGFRTVGDIAAASPRHFETLFGGRGRELWEMASGNDDRAVITEYERKSVGAETTFPKDLPDGPELREELARVAAHVAERLRKSGARARTIAIKLRYHNFHTITRQSSRPEPTDDEAEIATTAGALLDNVVEEGDKFRLLGIHASRLGEGGGEAVGQLPMLPPLET